MVCECGTMWCGDGPSLHHIVTTPQFFIVEALIKKKISSHSISRSVSVYFGSVKFEKTAAFFSNDGLCGIFVVWSVELLNER